MLDLKDDIGLEFTKKVEISPFVQRFPWIGGDLQTLRDTFVKDELLSETGEIVKIKVPSMPNGFNKSGYLLALLNRPQETNQCHGLVLMLHGLGGSSNRRGLRRMALKLINAGFAVLRLNLRGAIPGRGFASGTYSAKCNSDLEPAIRKAKEIAMFLESEKLGSGKPVPLFGVGISLGGTILLNSCLELIGLRSKEVSLLDGLICISSPLDLIDCSAEIEKPRNWFYQRWLLQRLIRQTLADPFGIKDSERDALLMKQNLLFSKVSSIRAFDSLITAPRWGFNDVDDYYANASPFKSLLENSFKMPHTLFIQSVDDPWVPFKATRKLFEKVNSLGGDTRLEVCLTSHGGHNGFHGINGCWGDDLVEHWLLKLVG